MAMDLARRLAMEGLLTDDELAAVVARRANSGEPVPVTLLALQLLGADAVTGLFERMGFTQARRLRMATVARTLPPGCMRALWALPIGESATGVVVAMADPTDPHALSELAFHLKRPIDPRIAPIDRLRAILADVDASIPLRPRNTRPAPAAPPPADSRPVSRLPPNASTETVEEIVRMASRPPQRRNTPAYGQKGPTHRSSPRTAAVVMPPPGADHRSAARVLSVGTGTIGSMAPRAMEDLAPEPARASAPPPPSHAPIPLERKAARRRSLAVEMPVPREALYTVAELRGATDRDTIGRVVARGMTAVAQRAAFFVVKRGVVQGWEGATVAGSEGPGTSREALRNLWIPITSVSVFKRVAQDRALYIGPLSDSTADSILAAALGGRPRVVLLAPIEVRAHVVAFIYADGLHDPRAASGRVDEIVRAAAEALERVIVAGRRG